MRVIFNVALALTAGFLAATCLHAAPTKPVPPPDPAVAAYVTQLHAVIKTLNEADHDYDGHRAKAVHLTHKAIHILHPHHKPPQPGTTTTTVKPAVKAPPTKEAQAISDAQLTNAMNALAKLQPQLATAGHTKASAEVLEAIAELKVALSIK
jgi:hypothetical protein